MKAKTEEKHPFFDMNSTNLEENYKKILQTIPKNVQLVVVSKTHPSEKIKQIYELGQRCFGENKVQELIEKQSKLPHEIQWHLIGHLQTNKVKYIAEFVNTIQSVDSQKLLEEINKQAEKHNRIINILLQVKIAEEDTKFGLDASEAKEIFAKLLQNKFPFVKIKGLMGLATYTDDEAQIRREFTFLKNIFDEFNNLKKLETLSMGMSGDYQLAINCGANSVRIGSAIFGERFYL